MLKKILKWIGFLLLFLLLLFIVAWGLLQLPSVQTKVVRKVAHSLESTLGAKVSIDRVNIKFFKTLSAEGIYIEDQQKDTLIYASSLNVNIGVFNLFDNEIFLNQITLNDGFLNIYQHTGDTSLNINFLIEALASDPADTSKTTWNFGIDAISLNRTRVRYDNEPQGVDLDLKLKGFAVDMNSLDLENKSIDIDKIFMDGNSITFLSSPMNLLQSDTIPTDPTAPVNFPYFGWDIQLGELEIKEHIVVYQAEGVIKKQKGINFKDLGFENVTVDLTDFVWREDELSVDVQQLSFLEKSGFQIDQLKGELAFAPQYFSLENFNIVTPNSNFNNTTEITFPGLSDLRSFTEKVNYELYFENTKIGVRDISLLAPIIGETKVVNINELKTVYLNGSITGNTKLVNIINAEIKVDQMLTLAVGGKLRNPTNPDALNFDVRLKKFASSYNQLNKIIKEVTLPPGLERFGTFNLSGAAKGTIVDFTATDLTLATDLATGFKLSGRVQNAPTPDKLLLDVNLENLTTNVKEIGYLVPDSTSMPSNLLPLGTISYTGNFVGGLKDMQLAGDLTTDIGSLTSDLKANFNADYSDATYEGDLALKSFQLNKIIGDSLGVGEITFSGKINGSGLTPETIQAKIDANIDHVVYRKYDYKNVKIDGTVDRKEFTGEFDITDPNITFDFSGRVNLNTDIPSFRFNMDIDTINLTALNLLDRDLQFSGMLNFDFDANSINNLNGFASFTNFAISDSTQSYFADSILLYSGVNEKGYNSLLLDAPFLKGEITGSFQLEEMLTLVIAYLNDYFPLDDYMSADLQKVRFANLESRQKFELRMELLDITPLQLLALPDLEYVESAVLTGNFDSKEQIMSLDAELKKVVYGKNKFEKFSWKADGTNLRLTNDLLLENLEAGGNEFPEITLANIVRRDSAYFQLNVKGLQDSIENLIQLGGIIDRPEKAYELRFNDQFILNDQNWEIPSDNLISYDLQQILINNLALQDGVHQLIVNTETPKNATVLIPDITIDFDQFQISEVSNLIVPGNDALGGEINGKVKVMEPTENIYFAVNLEVPDLTLNKESVGVVSVNLAKEATNSIIDVDVSLKGAVNDFSIIGNYGIDSEALDLAVSIKPLEMQLVDLLVDFIGDSKGTLDGEVRIKGTPAQPDINGTLSINQISSLIAETQVRYSVNEGKIGVDNETINLGQLTLRDTAGNTAELNGKLNHDFFTNLTYDVNINTDKFLVLNTTVLDNPLFYGKLILGAKIDVTGPLELPIVNVVANTLAGSKIALSPFADGDVALEEDYIIFGNPDTYEKPEDEEDIYSATASFPADVTLDLDLTSEALLEIVVDPVSGDKLKSYGTSDLIMRFKPSGIIEMYGIYTIANGEFQFSYTDVIRRNFDLVEGGTVLFNGDPLRAKFRATAQYNTKASTYELIASESTLSSGEVREARSRADVSVILDLEGNLASPELSFDIKIPDARENELGSAVTRKLVELRSNPNELNKQVFGLLLINSFIVSNSSTDFGNIGENVVLKSVSTLFSNQLNTLAEKFVKGVEVNFDLSSFKSDFTNAGSGGTVTELGVGVTKELLNNRLSLTAGGSVEVGDNTDSNASQIAGNFLVTYKLTDSGHYLLNVFRRSDFDVLNEESSIKTGIGISFTKSFDKEMREKEKEEKEEEKVTKKEMKQAEKIEKKEDKEKKKEEKEEVKAKREEEE